MIAAALAEVAGAGAAVAAEPLVGGGSGLELIGAAFVERGLATVPVGARSNPFEAELWVGSLKGSPENRLASEQPATRAATPAAMRSRSATRDIIESML